MTHFTYERRLLRRGNFVYFGRTLLGRVVVERPDHRPAWYAFKPILANGVPLSGGYRTRQEAAEALLRAYVYNMPL